MAAEVEEATGPGAAEVAPPADEAQATAAAPERTSACGEAVTSGEGQPYYGRVKSYNYVKGFGFLECPSVSARFGRDVFLRKNAVQEEVLLSRIASGSGPKAAVQRGDIFVRFVLAVNEAGHPEARDVLEVGRAEVPEEFLEGLPAAAARAAPPARPSGGKGAGMGAPGGREAPEPPAAESKKRSAKGASSGKEVEGTLLVGTHRCKVGRNAEDNWELLRAAKNKHWFFHLTDHPSAYVVLECEGEPTDEEKLRCAEICRDSSKMKLSGTIKVDATTCGNVSFGRRKDEVGECSYKKEKLVDIITVS